MITIFEHKAYSKILRDRDLERPNLPLVEMELTEQEIEELKKDILDFEKANHLETCGREIAMCFAYWFQHKYCGGVETKRAEEVADYIGLEKNKSKSIVDYGLNALKAWGVEVLMSNEGRQKKIGTLLGQGGTPINYVLQLVKNKKNVKEDGQTRGNGQGKNTNIEKGEIEIGQTRTNYLGFLTSLLREAPNYSSDWDKALENSQAIVSQVEASDSIPEGLKTPYLCKRYILIIRGIVENNQDLLNDLDESEKELVKTLKQIYNNTKEDIKELALRWKLMITQGQIYQYYSLINYNLIDPKKYDLETNDCNSFELIVGNNRFQYMKGKVNGKIVYRYRPQPTVNTDVYYDGMQPYVQAHILLGGQFHPIKLKNDTPINFDIPQILKESSGYYIPSTIMSDPSYVVVFNGEWQCDSVNSETVLYNNEEYHLIRFNNDLKSSDVQLMNINGELFMFKTTNTDYNIEIKGSDFDYITSSKYILTQNGPTINVYDVNGNSVITECKIVYRIHQSYNEKWKTKEEWEELPLGFIDVKIELPDQIIKSYTFFEMGKLMPSYVQADGDTTIIKWNTEDYPSSSVSIEETDREYFQINKQTEKTAQWKITRNKNKSYRPTCTFHLKANYVSPVINIDVKTLFKANFITETIDGKQYELENGEVLSYDKISNYSILVTNDGNHDVEMTISYISRNNVLETKTYTLSNNTIYQLSDFRGAIDELIDLRSHLYGLITTDRKLEIKIGDNRTYYLSRYQYDIVIEGGAISLTPQPINPCHLCAIPLVYPDKTVKIEEISPIELIHENGKYILQSYNERYHKFLIYSSKEDQERAIPIFLDTLSDNPSPEGRKIIIDAWANALKKETCTERDGVWDLCSRYFTLANEHSIHFSAFNCINAVMSSDFLLAKFIVHQIIVGNSKTKILGYLNSLEHEFLFSSYWISKINWDKVIMEEVKLPMMPGFYLENGELRFNPNIIKDDKYAIKIKRKEFTQKWQPAIFEIRSASFSSAMECGSHLFNHVIAPRNSESRGKNINTDLSFRNNKEKLCEISSIPLREDIQFCLKEDLYKLEKLDNPAAKQYLKASMYLAEVLCGKHEEIWKDENYRIRKQLLICQNFHSEILTQIVIIILDVILGKIKN